MSPGSWTQIAALARLAPTPHNTQPFRIRPLNARVAQILALPERMLPVEDTDNRYVLASFGIFAETLECAARHCGLELQVRPVEDLDTSTAAPGAWPVLLGCAEILGQREPEDTARILEARRTSRLPYHDRAVAPPVLAELAELAAAHGHAFESFDDPQTVRDVLRRNAMAILENNLKPDELAELRSWVRVGLHTPQLGDGLWIGPLNQPGWEVRLALALPRLFLLPGIVQVARARYLRTQAGTRHVAILRGRFRTWPELVEAGRLLMRLWLAMTRHGVYMLPFGSMITNAPCNRYLCERFSADDIWFILRFGYSPPPPRAPRLASVLWGEEACGNVGAHGMPRRSGAAGRVRA